MELNGKQYLVKIIMN